MSNTTSKFDDPSATTVRAASVLIAVGALSGVPENAKTVSWAPIVSFAGGAFVGFPQPTTAAAPAMRRTDLPFIEPTKSGEWPHGAGREEYRATRESSSDGLRLTSPDGLSSFAAPEQEHCMPT